MEVMCQNFCFFSLLHTLSQIQVSLDISTVLRLIQDKDQISKINGSNNFIFNRDDGKVKNEIPNLPNCNLERKN